MKKYTLAAAAALALLGTTSLSAQSFRDVLRPISVKARVGSESEYVFRGKEHSDFNLQTRVNLEYQLPSTRVGSSIYGNIFSMNPVTQSANLADFSLGSKLVYNDFLFDFGWIYHSFPNQNDLHWGIPGGAPNPITNRAIYNRSNELFLSAGTDYQGTKIAAWAYYDFNLEQLTLEANASRAFSFPAVLPGIEFVLSAYAGYVSAHAANADQRDAGIPKWRNDYGYIGGSVDLTYNVSEYTTIGVGVRYAWNSDGSWRDELRLVGNTSDNLWWGFWLRFAY
ncbi:MAG: hypothetical protein LBS59_07850 [Puniceicoccales bacterium]|jgi:hypothetical protein|nr:hypothetical protein [Puniceicoccales bacterium]